MRITFFSLLLTFTLSLSACQEETPQPVKPAEQAGNEQVAAERTAVVAQEQSPEVSPDQPEQDPPSPPVFEDFQGEPQLSLFPRIGDFRPSDDSDHLPYWKTFIEHLIKVSGVVEEKPSGNRSWNFRSINTIDSVGFFSPLSVEPEIAYQVTFKLTADLPEGASAGIGILEFNEFLWVSSQYTEEMYKQYFRRSQEGRRLSGKVDGEYSFTFDTGPETKMIHIVLFREGEHDRNNLMFDDIGIGRVKGEG